MNKVSIIITNYNKEKYIKRAIRSCLNQTYKNLEVIIVDDNSNKELVSDIARSFRPGAVRLIATSRNYGHYMCCNFAIDAARGEYITFLGADDRLERDHIRVLAAPLNKNKRLAASIGLYNRELEDGSPVGGTKLCEASIFFRKKSFVRDIGYFHPVRFAGDTEYRERAEKFYGKKAIIRINKNTYKALYLKNSLTTTPSTKGGSAARVSYVNSFRKNIKINSGKKLRFDYKLQPLPFALHRDIAVKDFDIKTFSEIRL